MPLQAIVPAAGRGSRLRPLTDDRPKGLVPIGDRPLLDHVFEAIVELGVDRLVVVVGYRGTMIVDHYGESFHGVPLTYVDQEEPRGLAHAIGRTAGAIEREGFVAIMNGDNVVRGDLERVIERGRMPKRDGAVLVEPVGEEAARRTGIVVTDVEGRVTHAVERPSSPPSRLAIAGFGVFRPSIVDACQAIDPGPRGEYEYGDAIDRYVTPGRRVVAIPLEGWRVNVNTAADRRRAEALLARHDGG